MRRLVKTLAVITGIILFLALGLHFWLWYKSKYLLEFIVNEVSGGQYEVKANQVRFSYFPAELRVSKLKLYPKQNNKDSAYFVSTADSVHVELSSLAGLLFFKRLGVKELRFVNPDVHAYQSMTKTTQNEGSIAQSVEKLQEALFQTFDALQVQNAAILKARITVSNIEDSLNFFSLSDIDLLLRNINVRTVDGFKDSIQLKGDIQVDIKNPRIHFMDPRLSVQLGNLSASNTKHSMNIDSIQFRYQKDGGRYDSVQLASVSIKKLNWSRYLREGLLELDSVIVARGQTSLDFTDRNLFTQKKKSGKTQVYTGQSMIIHYAAVSDIQYQLQTMDDIRGQQVKSTFRIGGNSFEARDISLQNLRTPALAVRSMFLNFTNFSDLNSKAKFSSTLGALLLSSEALTLRDYKLQTGGSSTSADDNRLIIPELKLEQYSLQDLLMKRLVARKLTILNPALVIDILKKKGMDKKDRKNPNFSIGQFTNALSNKIDLKDVEVRNASIRMLPQGSVTNAIQISGLNVQIDGGKALNAGSVMDLIHAVNAMTTSGFSLTGKNIDLKISEVKMLSNPRGIYLGRVKGKLGEGNEVDLEGVTVLNRFQTLDLTNKDDIEASDIIVEKGIITLNRQDSSTQKTGNLKTLPLLKAANLDLRNIVLAVKKNNQPLASTQLHIKAVDFALENNAATWKSLSVNSSDNLFVTPTLQLSAGSIAANQPGTIVLNNAEAVLQDGPVSISVSGPSLVMDWGIQGTRQSTLTITKVHLEKPVIKLYLPKNETTAIKPANIAAKSKSTPMHLDYLEMNDALIDIEIPHEDAERVIKSKSLSGNFKMTDLHISNEPGMPRLTAKKMEYRSSQFSTQWAGQLFSPANIFAKLSNFVLDETGNHWRSHIDTLALGKLSHTIIGDLNDTLDITIEETGLANYDLAQGDKPDWQKMLAHEGGWTRGMFVQYRNPKQTISMEGGAATTGPKPGLGWEKLSFLPRQSRDAFWTSEPFENDYITIHTGMGKAENIMLTMNEKKPSIAIGRMLIKDANIVAERDVGSPGTELEFAL